jgi:hypothetical protein
MLAQVLQIFLGREHLVKNRLISTLDKVYIKGTIFQRSTKPLFTLQNRVEISWKKVLLFFKHASSSVSKISMAATLNANVFRKNRCAVRKRQMSVSLLR